MCQDIAIESATACPQQPRSHAAVRLLRAKSSRLLLRFHIVILEHAERCSGGHHVRTRSATLTQTTRGMDFDPPRPSPETARAAGRTTLLRTPGSPGQ